MPQLTPQDTFSRFVPAAAVSYCIQLWHECKFDLKITPRRSTKLGDYRYDYQTKRHTISINHDLNKFGFLVTYLHEIAHLKTFNKFGNKVLPHGSEWKKEFQILVAPILNSETFPDKVFFALKKYISNPKASSCSDPSLTEAIRSFDKDKPEISLIKLGQGEKFYFQNRVFIKEELRRTRYVCQEVKTGKKYLIPKIAEVIKVDEQ
jgi:SprT protein